MSSWVNDKLDRCYQLMETEDRGLLDQWIANWSDIVDFEVYLVISSKEAGRLAPAAREVIPGEFEELRPGKGVEIQEST